MPSQLVRTPVGPSGNPQCYWTTGTPAVLSTSIIAFPRSRFQLAFPRGAPVIAEADPTEGYDPIADCPFTLVEIEEVETFEGIGTYRLKLTGNAQQYSYEDLAQIVMP